jgi:hypothetical protein
MSGETQTGPILTDKAGRFSIPNPPGKTINVQGVEVRATGFAPLVVHRPQGRGTTGPGDLWTIVLQRQDNRD